MEQTLILITGMPGTGKTTLSKKMASGLGIALVSKDVIKEILYDELGTNDRQWSRKLGVATFKILDYLVQEQLKCGNSVILESPLNPAFNDAKMRDWQEAYGFDCIQIFCEAEPKVVMERMMMRVGSGERHPGHADLEGLSLEGVEEAGRKYRPLKLAGEVIRVDTTDFAKVDADAMVNRVKRLINA